MTSLTAAAAKAEQLGEMSLQWAPTQSLPDGARDATAPAASGAPLLELDLSVCVINLPGALPEHHHRYGHKQDLEILGRRLAANILEVEGELAANVVQ